MSNSIDTAAEREKLATLEGHTPGTWEWHGEYFDDLRPVWWCEMTQGQGYIGWDDDNAKEANAALIAAAPDLKATLAAALDEIDRLREELETEKANVALAYESAANLLAVMDGTPLEGWDYHGNPMGEILLEREECEAAVRNLVPDYALVALDNIKNNVNPLK